MTPVDLVLIGRNEGARLVAGLASVAGAARRVVYVDSGSTDGSVAAARDAGAEVVELDMSIPFTAARARNAGFQALRDTGPEPEFVQFIDGDCSLVAGWIDAARAHLAARPDLAVVTGWRSEIHRNASVYNQMCDVEWHRPAGPIIACGGDMMVRAEAFIAVGGFDPTVIAAEDDEFCIRLRKAGWGLERLPLPMTRHDAAMTRFEQWWQRAVRAGHGFAQVGQLHPEHFRPERKRVLIYGGALPLIGLGGAVMAGPWPLLAVLSIYALSYVRTIRGLTSEGLDRHEALRHAALLTISKFPGLIGMATFRWRQVRNAQMKIIEYK